MAQLQNIGGLRAQRIIRGPANCDTRTEGWLRLSMTEIAIIVDEFHDYRVQERSRSGPLTRNLVRATSERSVRAFLHFLARGGYYHQVGIPNGVAGPTVLKYSREVVEYFLTVAHLYVSLPAPAEFPLLARPLNGKQVILFVDGVLVRIQRPAHAGRTYYSARDGKACDSLNVQIVCDSNGKIRHIVYGNSGATHDKIALESSRRFMRFVDSLPPQYVVAADKAYRGFHPQVMIPKFTPAHGQLSAGDRTFNANLNAQRAVVERVIGCLETKWRITQHKERRFPALGGPIFAGKCMVAAAMLHNRFTNYV